MVIANTSDSSDAIKVTVSKLGEAVVTLTLSAGTTVGEALEKAGYTNCTARSEGEVVPADAVLEDGDDLFVGANTKNEA